jgi:hypothetical protein
LRVLLEGFRHRRLTRDLASLVEAPYVSIEPRMTGWPNRDCCET